MQTMAPPEEAPKELLAPMDERFVRVNERFDEVNRRIIEGREETNRRFDALATEMSALRQEMVSLHAAVHRGNYTLLAAMLGLIAAILAKGG